jgi:NAD(P)-dependent dehydrogenase (short-subunit alcohol dehydrogenase family)
MNTFTTPYGPKSTANEVIEGVDLQGKNAIVTGGASGIGLETTKALSGAGAHVTVAVRDIETATEALDDLESNRVDARALDLTDRASIQAFIDVWDKPLHILINNAGVMAAPETRTVEGWELQFATNQLGHFQLTRGLHRSLADASGARVVAVGSSGHLLSPVVFDDVHFRFRAYDPVLAYAQSKSAVNLFAVAADSRWSGDGIRVNALNPGAIETRLQRHVGGKLVTPPEDRKTPEQGASTSVLLAASPLLDDIGGRYFNDCAEAETVDHKPDDPAILTSSVADYSLDPENAERIWSLSERMVDDGAWR